MTLTDASECLACGIGVEEVLDHFNVSVEGLEVDVAVVVRMGWTSSDMLQKVYGHLFEDQQRQRVARFGSIYGEQAFGEAIGDAPQTRHEVARLAPARVESAS